MLIVDSCVFIDTFAPESSNHHAAVRLFETLRARKLLITMPAHGWFEIQCALQHLKAQQGFVGPSFDGEMSYEVKFIYIDKQFLLDYQMADIPYIKSGDHIFLAVAKVEDCPLITSDNKMIDKAKECGVHVFKPVEYLNELGECI